MDVKSHFFPRNSVVFLTMQAPFLNDTLQSQQNKLQLGTQGNAGLPVLYSCKVSDNFILRQGVMKMAISNCGKGRKMV